MKSLSAPLVVCCTHGADGKTWTYLQSVQSGKRGWVRDDLLRLNPSGSRGSVKPCNI